MTCLNLAKSQTQNLSFTINRIFYNKCHILFHSYIVYDHRLLLDYHGFFLMYNHRYKLCTQPNLCIDN
jgi:hypothetical protein